MLKYLHVFLLKFEILLTVYVKHQRAEQQNKGLAGIPWVSMIPVFPVSIALTVVRSHLLPILVSRISTNQPLSGGASIQGMATVFPVPLDQAYQRHRLRLQLNQ